MLMKKTDNLQRKELPYIEIPISCDDEYSNELKSKSVESKWMRIHFRNLLHFNSKIYFQSN